MKDNLIAKKQGRGTYSVPRTEDLNALNPVLLIQNDNDYIYPGLIANIKAAFRRNQLSLTCHVTKNNVNREREILLKLLQEKISLLIVEGVHSLLINPNLDLYEKLQMRGTKLVFLFQGYPELENTVTIFRDDVEAGRQLARLFISRGICDTFCIFPDYSASARDRFYGIQMEFKDNHLPMPCENVYWYGEKEIRGLRQSGNTGFLTSFIKSCYLNQNGIFCYTDEISYYLIKELTYAGISVPEQVAVAGFDNSYLCNLSLPSITSAGLDPQEPGLTLEGIIHDLLHDIPLQNKTLPYELHTRGSVSPVTSI